MYSLPRETHRYFIERVTQAKHPKVLMASRLVGFHNMLKQSERPVINLLAAITERDCRTVLGSNLKKISRECNKPLENLSSQVIKQTMRYSKTPESDEWKIPIILELLQTRCNSVDISNVEQNEMEEMIRIITT